MTDATTPSTTVAAPRPASFRDEAARKRLKKRHAAEQRFKFYGMAAIGVALAFLVLFVFSIGSQALTAFSHHKIKFDLPLTEEVVAPEGVGDTEAIAENVSGFYQLVREDLARRFPEAAQEGRTRELNDLVTRLAVLPMARATAENPGRIGETVRYTAALSDDLDLYLKGAVAPERRMRLDSVTRADRIISDGQERLRFEPAGFFDGASAYVAGVTDGTSILVQSGTSVARWTGARDFELLTGTSDNFVGTRPEARIIELPEDARNVTDRQIAWTLALQEDGRVSRGINWALMSNADSTYPEIAGVLAAIVGSLFTMLITAMIAIPIGISAALYLEEYAPKNRLTDLIEVNINNLAAVPSIVFGLLGAAVFLNFFALPRSAPLVGGLVLGLLTLPTVIIASRAALRSVPPSIRSAALGVGASKTQTVLHHVLPLAAPGIMTGAIIGMARALGETAPLLLIGMVAFVAEVPSGPTDEATALPVLIFKWSTGAERAWEPNTAAAIVVLLTFMVLMNALAVFVRRRFERRW
ncbi:MAG: phosphate ABC transporter permease PstA [Pseudomonadota bacterium]